MITAVASRLMYVSADALNYPALQFLFTHLLQLRYY